MELLKEQNASVAKTILKCFIHPMQDLKLYCINCDQVACHNCTILLHKGHKFEPIARATKREIKEFKDSFERNQKFHEYVNDSISKLGGSMPKINANADTVQVNSYNPNKKTLQLKFFHFFLPFREKSYYS